MYSTAPLETPPTQSRQAPKVPPVDYSRISEVNGMRGVAILAVLFSHIWGAHYFLPGWNGTLGAPLSNGWMGVNLFFVLSGFVLFLPYSTKARQMDRPGMRSYFKRRAQRLLPLFALVALVGIFLNSPFFGNGERLKTMLVVLTGVFHFTKEWWYPPGNDYLWSLGAEIWFSILFPVLVILFKWAGARRTIVGIFLFALGVRLAGSILIPSDHLSLPYLNPIKDSVFGRLDDFAAGMAVAYCVTHHPPLTARRATIMQAIGLLFILVGMVLWDHHAQLLTHPWSRAFYNIPISLGCAFILYGCVLGDSAAALNRLLRSKLLHQLGLMCFSIYAWHFFLIDLISPKLLGAGSVLTFLIALACIATLSYRYIEFGNQSDLRSLFPLFARRKRSFFG